LGTHTGECWTVLTPCCYSHVCHAIARPGPPMSSASSARAELIIGHASRRPASSNPRRLTNERLQLTKHACDCETDESLVAQLGRMRHEAETTSATPTGTSRRTCRIIAHLCPSLGWLRPGTTGRATTIHAFDNRHWAA
jgi:hypothetical protein